MQKSVIESINNNPQAGWKAFMNPRFANYTVSFWINFLQKISIYSANRLTCCYCNPQVAQFKHLLGVKPMPEGDLKGISVITHKQGLKLPEKFDARTAWPQCTTIADILGQLFYPFRLMFPQGVY